MLCQPDPLRKIHTRPMLLQYEGTEHIESRRVCVLYVCLLAYAVVVYFSCKFQSVPTFLSLSGQSRDFQPATDQQRYIELEDKLHPSLSPPLLFSFPPSFIPLFLLPPPPCLPSLPPSLPSRWRGGSLPAGC